MTCFHPIDAYRAPNGTIVFSKRYGWEDKPMKVPCGQCIGCRLEKSRQWAVRIMHESKLYADNSFLTLTYSDDALPAGETLVKSHHQLFMKRLRQKYKNRILRFYHCGEYGSETHRPHYHTIVFNLKFDDQRFHKTSGAGKPIYTSETLDRLWGFGHCTISDVTFQSAAYCARYVMKKLTGARAHEYGTRLPEYSTMSRGGRGGLGGIGAPWLKLYNRDVFPLDAVILDGKKVRVPKSYESIVAADEADLGEWGTDATGFPLFYPSIKSSPLEKIKNGRVRKARAHASDQTPERLAVREEVTKARLERLKRQ